jgi:MFS family permease
MCTIVLPSPTHVKRRYYSIVLLYNTSAALIWGVNTLFLLEAGLDLFETFVANAFFTAGQVLFEIPTGVTADTVGRRFSFLMSCIILAFGTAAYVALAYLGIGHTPSGLFWFSAASVILGLGFTFYSGAVEAWIVDALTAVGAEGSMEKVFARGGQFMGLSIILGTITGGLLGTLDLTYPYVARAALLLVCFLVAFRGMHDMGFETRKFEWRKIPKELGKITKISLTHGIKNPPVRLLMLMSLLNGSFLMWAYYAWQPYILELVGRPDAAWITGLVAAGLGVVMIVGGGFAAWLGGRIRRSTGIALASLVFCSGMFGVGYLQPYGWPAVLASFFVGMAAFSVIGPLSQAALHDSIPSTARATVVSFKGLMGSTGGVVGQPLLGAYTRSQGIGPGYMVGGIFMLPMVVLGAMLRRHKQCDVPKLPKE